MAKLSLFNKSRQRGGFKCGAKHNDTRLRKSNRKLRGGFKCGAKHNDTRLRKSNRKLRGGFKCGAKHHDTRLRKSNRKSRKQNGGNKTLFNQLGGFVRDLSVQMFHKGANGKN